MGVIKAFGTFEFNDHMTFDEKIGYVFADQSAVVPAFHWVLLQHFGTRLS
jgi:hypothetical protein